jgi:hypothetical protein
LVHQKREEQWLIWIGYRPHCGNPVRMIQTITILVIAIAKLDWILAIDLLLLGRLYALNEYTWFPHLDVRMSLKSGKLDFIEERY